MPRHDPTPPSAERQKWAWRRYKALMSWMGLAAACAAGLALLYLWIAGVRFSIHLVVATTLGVSLTVLLGTALMGLVFMSSISGHDETAGRKDEADDRRQE